MTLTDIARKNLRKNLKQYSIYMNSMIVTIMIFFTFMSLKFNEDLLNAAGTLDKIEPALNAAAVVLFLFATVFVLYSNSFFTNKRKKEIGLYALFGMPKEQIAVLMFYENMMIGSISLLIGIIGGLFLSKLFAMIIIKLMGFSVIGNFSFSLEAIFYTSIIFIIISIISSIQSYRLIYRFPLVELFKAERVGDRIPDPSLLKSIIAVLVIGFGYWLLLDKDASFFGMNDGFSILFSIISIIVGTYLLFSSGIIFLFRLLKNNKKFAFRGSNLISLSQMQYRLKSNFIILTVIALLSTLTIFAMSVTYNFYYQSNKIAEENFPYSYVVAVPEQNSDDIKEILHSDSEHKVIFEEKLEYLSLQAEVSELKRIPEFFQKVVIPESSIKKILKDRSINLDIELENNESLAFYDGNLDVQSDDYTGKTIKITNSEYELTIKAYLKYSLINQGQHVFPLVVSDEFFNDLALSHPSSFIDLYNLDEVKDADELDKKIENYLVEKNLILDKTIYSSYYREYHKLKETYGLLIFLSAFLGLVFLLATGSIIYFKQLTEATTDKGRYVIMKKLGMSAKDISRSLHVQILWIFTFPVLIALLHSSVLVTSLSRFINKDATIPYLTCVAAYILIYLGYYFLTVNSYGKMLKEK